jgi:D-tyrosyl-tRNA(Tyr) deacylase
VRAVIQRVSSATVTVGGEIVGQIGPGLLVLVGVEQNDGPGDVQYMAGKVRELRVFEDAGEAVGQSKARHLNRSVQDVGGGVLVVSQFTLAGDCRRGRRPSFDRAAAPALAKPLYDALVNDLRHGGLTVATGEFQAQMKVSLVNDGPVTLLLDSRRQF